MFKTANRRVIIYLIVFAIFVFLGVFVLPFLVLPIPQTVSASYDYQFNNRVSVIALCVSLFIAFIIFYKPYNSKIRNLQIENVLSSNVTDGLNFRVFYILSCIHAIAILCLYILNANYGYGESNYFLLCIDRLFLNQVPYKDFEFAYGILLLYLPKLITDLFRFSTSVEGYYISLVLLNTIGIYFLYRVINSFNIDKKKKAVIFFSIGLSCIPISLGMNYILIRFVTPIISILFFDKLIRRFERNETKGYILIALAAMAIALVNFAISMEIGIALFLAFLVYFFLSIVVSKKRLYLITTLVCGGIVALILFLLSDNIGLIIKSFASGGNNWVVVPSPSIVLFIASFLIVNFIFCFWIFKINFSFIPCSLLAFNIIMLAGVFGRCDPGHVFWYGLGSFIAMWVFIAYLNKKYFKVYTIAFVLIFVIGMNVSGLYLFRIPLGILVGKYILQTGKASSLKSFASHLNFDASKIDRFAQRVMGNVDYNELNKHKSIALPFDADKDVYLYLLKKRIYKPEYYTGYLNVFTPDQINAKLRSLQDSNHKYMVIPQAFLDFKISDNENAEEEFISVLFLYPFDYSKEKTSQKMYAPLFNYINKNYRPVKIVKKETVLVERIN